MERGGNYSWPVSRYGNPVAVETALFSLKWDQCMFMCPVCNKVSNEKRLIRSHTLSAHSTSMEQPAFPDYRSRWQPGHHSHLNVCVFVQ